MMKHSFFFVSLLLASTYTYAEDVPVTECQYAGPYMLERPVMIDSVNLQGKTFQDDEWLKAPINFSALKDAKTVMQGQLPACNQGSALHLLGFNIQNTSFTEAEIKVSGLHNYRLLVDGKECGEERLHFNPPRMRWW